MLSGVSRGVRNSQYGVSYRDRLGNSQKRIDEARLNMSRAQSGENNGNATPCSIYAPNGDVLKFKYLNEMDRWVSKKFHVKVGYRLGENTPKKRYGNNRLKKTLHNWYYKRD